MANVPNELRYTREHEWAKQDGDRVRVGITAYAQEQLGDVVFVELPDVGRKVQKGKDMAVVESVKAASEVYAPVTGEIVETNGGLLNEPATVNADATGAGWFCKIRLADKSELKGLMDAAAYKKFIEGLS